MGYYYSYKSANNDYQYDAYLYNGSNYASLTDPLGVNGTYAPGISDATMVGYYVDSSEFRRSYKTNMPDFIGYSSRIAHYPSLSKTICLVSVLVSTFTFLRRRRNQSRLYKIKAVDIFSGCGDIGTRKDLRSLLLQALSVLRRGRSDLDLDKALSSARAAGACL